MAILNYRTKIAPEKTISEIQSMLARHGVAAIMTEYEGPNVSSVSFKLVLDGKPMGFRLPCSWRAVREVFKNDPKVRGQYDTDEQAVRTAWRIINDWVQAQLALVEVNMVSVPEVFLPYAITKDGRTLSETVLEDPSRLLGNGV